MATRHLSPQPSDQGTRERFLLAALNVLLDQGVTKLTVRAVAEAAGASTIAVYTRFGGRSGLLDALYERTFDALREMLEALPPASEDGVADLIDIAVAYRRFALEGPSRYALMFERPVPDFNPDPGLRAVVIRTTFAVFVGQVQRVSPDGTDARSAAYSLWATMHGLVSSELTLGSRAPLPEWFIAPTESANEQAYLAGVTAMIAGLGLRAP